MKSPRTILVLLGLAFSAALLRAETPGEARQRQALEILRQTISEQRQQAAAVAKARKGPTLAEMQRRYLEGKISAREYEKFVRNHQPEAVAPPVARQTNPPAPAKVVIQQPPPAHAATNAAASPAPIVDKAARNKAIAEAEAKLDELANLKAAREKEATNSPTSAAPKTKRERLDEVLRQFVGGKISEDEYKDQRSKILAEPN